MRRQIGSAITAAAVCATAFAVLLPRATDAGAMLIAQDDPVQLADLQLESALRNDPALIGRNVEAALAAQDPDLANSFVDLAAAKGMPIPDKLSQRVTEAVGEKIPAKVSQRDSSLGLSQAMPSTGPVFRARSPATFAYLVMSGTSCGRAGIWRWARIPTGCFWGSPRQASS